MLVTLKAAKCNLHFLTSPPSMGRDYISWQQRGMDKAKNHFWGVGAWDGPVGPVMFSNGTLPFSSEKPNATFFRVFSYKKHVSFWCFLASRLSRYLQNGNFCFEHNGTNGKTENTKKTPIFFGWKHVKTRQPHERYMFFRYLYCKIQWIWWIPVKTCQNNIFSVPSLLLSSVSLPSHSRLTPVIFRLTPVSLPSSSVSVPSLSRLTSVSLPSHFVSFPRKGAENDGKRDGSETEARRKWDGKGTGLRRKVTEVRRKWNLSPYFFSFPCISFHFLSFPFIFFSFPFIFFSFPFISFHFLSFPFIFLSFPCICLHFLSLPVMSSHFLSCVFFWCVGWCVGWCRRVMLWELYNRFMFFFLVRGVVREVIFAPRITPRTTPCVKNNFSFILTSPKPIYNSYIYIYIYILTILKLSEA